MYLLELGVIGGTVVYWGVAFVVAPQKPQPGRTSNGG